jgi:cyanophycin synthetase
MTGPVASRMVLTDPHVTVAGLETARGGLLRAGLGYRYPDVACCLNVAADHLGLGGIETLDQLAEVKRIPIDVARDTVVLNADDANCLRMADHTAARRICWVTTRPDNALVREHVREGGRAVALEAGINGQMITLYDNGAHMPLLWTHLIPATLEGKALHNVQNAMFAAGMAWSMGVKLDDIRHGLRTFDTTFFQAPGRGNVYDQHGFKVILDYGHNPAAVDAMCSVVDGFAAEGLRGKRVCVLAAPGDRRDEDIRAIARRAARSFDRFVCRRDDNPRGRGPDEVPEMLADELRRAGVEDARIDVVLDEQAAVEHAMRLCAPGDVLLVFGDAVTRCWKQIVHFGGRKPVEAPAAPAGWGGVGTSGGAYTAEVAPSTPPASRTVAQAQHPSAADERAERAVVAPAPPAPVEPRGFVRDARGVRLAPDEGGD